MVVPTPCFGAPSDDDLAALGAPLAHPGHVGDDIPDRLGGGGDRPRRRERAGRWFISTGILLWVGPAAQATPPVGSACVDVGVVEQAEVAGAGDVEHVGAGEHRAAPPRPPDRGRVAHEEVAQGLADGVAGGPRERGCHEVVAGVREVLHVGGEPLRRSRIPTLRYSRIRPNGADSGNTAEHPRADVDDPFEGSAQVGRAEGDHVRDEVGPARRRRRHPSRADPGVRGAITSPSTAQAARRIRPPIEWPTSAIRRTSTGQASTIDWSRSARAAPFSCTGSPVLTRR